MAVSRTALATLRDPDLCGLSFLLLKGLLCCPVEDTPIVRRAHAGKAAELRAACSFGSRRANHGVSQSTDETNNVEMTRSYPS